jgi:hypothetical protein
MKIKSQLLILSFLTCVSSQAFAAALQTQSTQAQLDRLEAQLHNVQAQVRILKKRQIKHHRLRQPKAPRCHKIIRLTHHTHFFAFNDSVVIAPYTEQATFNTGNELIINSPSIYEDVKLLYRRHVEQQNMIKAGMAVPDHPRLLLSGKVEGEAVYEKPYAGSHTSDIDLSAAELDVFAEISKWVNGFMAMSYDNTAGATPRRISNSNIYLDKGFLLLGNFNKTHWYSSAGQLYVPFGRYSSNMISDPLTKAIGRVKARAITIGYAPACQPNSPFGSVFVFKGDSNYSGGNNINNGGFDFGYEITRAKASADVGVSYVYNIADAAGMQNNGVTATGTSFGGFDASSVERISHHVPGGSVHGVFSYGPLSLLGEYVTALRAFDVANLNFDGYGAKPKAFNVEGAYVFHVFSHPGSFAIGYSRSGQALAFNIPKQRYYAVFAMTILNNTKASLEFRHDKNYLTTDTARGQNIPAFVASQLGKTDNAVTAQLTVYF